MSLLRVIMRTYSYLFHLLLSVFLLAVSGIAMASGLPNLHLGMLPWMGKSLTYWLFGLGLAGVAAVWLAWKGIWRIVFLLWSLAVLVMLVRGFFLSSYHFAFPSQFWSAVYLSIGAFAAAIGGWVQLRR